MNARIFAIGIVAAGMALGTAAWAQAPAGSSSKPAAPGAKPAVECPYGQPCPVHDARHMDMEMMHQHMEAMKADMEKMQAELNTMQTEMSQMKTEDPAMRKVLEANASMWTMLVNHMKEMQAMCDKMCARMGHDHAWHGHDMKDMPPHWAPKHPATVPAPQEPPPSNRK